MKLQVKMKLLLVALALSTTYFSVEALLNNPEEILANFKSRYNNSKSDLIFLLDTSGSVRPWGFNTEKIFVDSLLNEFSVAPYSTRVAVITFGSEVKTDINYIDIDGTDRNKTKCEFKPKFQYQVRFRGGMTNMKDGFGRAINLLQTTINNSRKRIGVHTVAMMITDGWWNLGSPLGNTATLKSQYGVDIFAVGVAGYNTHQLTQIASTSQHVLKFNTFNKFRELAMYIRGDAHDKRYMDVDKAKCTTTSGCDKKAFCSCGTVSGIYQCVCKRGYYGAGVTGHCYPCRRGTYKEHPDPDECKACPVHSSTSGTGSIARSDCRCNEGYEGNPARKIPCQPVRCEQLSSPTNGRIVGSCGHVYRSKCEFACNEGHNLLGSRTRTCQKTKVWSGSRVTCQVVRCAGLPKINHGTKSCTGSGDSYSDTCTFSCQTGYDLKGSSSRVCQKDGQWTGSATSCEARKCPALRRLPFGIVDPVDCVTSPQPYQRGCVLKCVPGYDMEGDSVLKCGPEGKWLGAYPSCIDKRPPSILCPAAVTTGTDPERPVKTLTFDLPKVSDNAELHDNNAKPKLSQSPADIKSPHEFAIGTHRITYTARDTSNNTASCVFTVTVKDTEKPQLYCPPNKEVNKKTTTPTVHVIWDPPTVFDNSDGKVTAFTESVNGSSFSVGEYTIKYTATDSSGNTAECSFIILVASTKCKSYEPPSNGLVACKYTNIWGGDTCTPQCNAKFEFSRAPAIMYICQASGQWLAFDYRPQVLPIMPWPDCSEAYVPGAARKGMEWQYYTGDCSDPAVQRQAKLNFVQGMTHALSMIDPFYCQREKVCNIENVKVSCGKSVEVSGGKKKRSIVRNVLIIDLDLEVFSRGQAYAQVKSRIEDYTNKLKSNSMLQSLTVSGAGTTTLRSMKPNATEAVCKNGTVLGMNKLTAGKCQSCPAGSFYSSSAMQCQRCPSDTYQEQTARLLCNKCPLNTFTATDGANNKTKCLPACQPGQYSSTGLTPCEVCDVGKYQPSKRGLSCIDCPGSTTTLGKGAKSIAECGMPCAPGSYSVTGVEPCLPCAKGFYQPKTEQTACLRCPNRKSTYGRGAASISQCTEIDECSSSPCNNEGTCLNSATGYECECPQGFSGVNCEVEKDECVTSPCYQGSTCVDKVNGYICQCPPGYTGRHCDIKTNDCTHNPCVNGGKCLDTPNGFDCACKDGYSGTFCEHNVNECKPETCRNGGVCVDLVAGFKCNCPQGFSGDNCEINNNACAAGSCLNGGTCTNTKYGHLCSCLTGFAGSRCEVDINACASTPCKNNGYCVDQKDGFKCLCKPSFTGSLCEKELSSDGDLVFERRKGRGLSIIEMRQELRVFTVSFWMKAPADNYDPGTPLSYAVKRADGTVDDNALVIHDYNGFNIWINGRKVSTGVAANDDGWHHMAFTWKSSTGYWRVYKDGSEVKHGYQAFQKDQVIQGGGFLVLGQEQDNLGSNFTASEAFIGSISQVNIWNYELNPQMVQDMSRHADHASGNVVSWPDFMENADDGVIKVAPSRARKENKCWSHWYDKDNPNQGDGDRETRPSSCPSASGFACQTLEGLGMNEVDYNYTQPCSTNGIHCRNSDQYMKQCEDFKVRFVCSCPANDACVKNSPCHNGGQCVTLPIGYKCRCPTGFEGTNCERALHCPNPGPIAHGTVQGSFGHGSSVTITCHAGFRLNGAASLRCHAGKWNARIPMCEDINECSQGRCRHSCHNTIGGYRCTCAPGYSPQSDGTCADINECSVNRGNCQHSCHNSVGSYRCMCRTGYDLGADGRSCVDRNECSSNQGRGPCEQKCVNTLGGSRCECNNGYILDSDGKRCRGIACPSLSAPADGQRAPASGGSLVNTVVRLSCNAGYRLVGSAVRTCQSDGQWSGPPTTCQPVRCINSGSLENGRKSGTGTSYGSSVSYTCNGGYIRVGSGTRMCDVSSTWSGEHPRCLRSDCQSVAAPAHGHVIGAQLTVGSTVRFECAVGYKRIGAAYAVCTENGQWSHSPPTCSFVNCGAPSSVANGQVHGSNFFYGAKVTYTCNAGHHLSGISERVCQANGEWSGDSASLPQCLARSCGDPGTPDNGIKKGDVYTYGSQVTFVCNEGYTLAGSNARTCQTDGKWSGTLPSCQAVHCNRLEKPANGERFGDDFTYNKIVRFECEPGFKLIGSRERKCQLNGEWSGSQPSCSATSCGSPRTGPSGRLTSSNYPNNYDNNDYCRWTISVPAGKKVMVTFTDFKTQQDKDVVELYDGISGMLITRLSGVYGRPISFTSQSNVMDIRFSSDADDSSQGFEAQYQQVSCGGIVTSLNSVIQSPNYPSHYPNGVTCVWTIKIGQAFQLEFDAFNTEQSYDFLKAYNSLQSFSMSNMALDIEGNWFRVPPVKALSGEMLLKFTSNAYNSRPGFKLAVKTFKLQGKR